MKCINRAREILENNGINVNSFDIDGSAYGINGKTNPLLVSMCQLAVEIDKERYEKAFAYAESQCCAGMVCIDLDTVNEALKIASGLEEK